MSGLEILAGLGAAMGAGGAGAAAGGTAAGLGAGAAGLGLAEGLAAAGAAGATSGSMLAIPELLTAASMGGGGMSMLPAAIPEFAYAAAPAAMNLAPSVAPGAVMSMVENTALNPAMASEVMAAAPGVAPSWGIAGTPSIAPGMLDASMAGLNLPPTVAGPGKAAPFPWRDAFGTAGQGYLDMRKLGIDQQIANKPSFRADAPNMRPGQPAAVKVGQPIARRTSPLERYAMMWARRI